MHSKLSLTGLLCFLMLHRSEAQTSFSFPEYFDQFYNNYYLVNPANADSSYKLSANVANRTQTGLFQGVSKLYMDVDLRLSSRKNVFHFAGIQAINNKEGDFIHKSRLLGRYSWRGKLSYHSSLSAGIALGFINYAFTTSQSGAGGSAWVQDGNAGIWFLRKKLSVGCSMQQFFNQRIRPVNQSFLLESYYILTANYFFIVNPFLKIHTHFYSKFQNHQPVYFTFASIFELQKNFEAGASYSYNRGFSGLAGIKKLKIGGSHFSFYFSYSVSSTIVQVNDNAFELLAGWKL